MVAPSPIPMNYWNIMTSSTDQEKHYLNYDFFKLIIILKFIILIYLNLNNIHTDEVTTPNTLVGVCLW